MGLAGALAVPAAGAVGGSGVAALAVGSAAVAAGWCSAGAVAGVAGRSDFAGLLVAASGFQPLFFIVLAAQVAALLLLIIKVREPRHRAPLF